MKHTKRNFKTLSDYVSFGRFETYYLPLKKDLRPGIPQLFTQKYPFPYPPGAIDFTKDGNILFFTKPLKTKSGSLRYVIFRAKLDPANKEWIRRATPLPFCNHEYSYMQPAISPDGKTLVFSSDMPTAQKGTNLFKSSLSGSGWSDPVNLGIPINSNADELFPFLDDYNNLYFSSNRGSDNFDIYVARFNGTGWDKPLRLAKGINSGNNDMIFKVNPNDTLAFLIAFGDTGKAQLQFFRLSLADSMKIPPVIAEGPRPDSMAKVRKATTPKTIVQHNVAPSKLAESKKVIPAITPVSTPKPIPAPPHKPSDIVFKVQIVASMVPSGSYAIWINHKKYYTWEYFYQGAYRYTIGEFNNVEDALKLKALCRQAGYSQAFVAAFRNNKRILDPKVFRH
ncbi:MAG: PD40 domain-containing protein [Bacteroidales bacterium]|nr:PD40 domain-containing protein [Bacteroidales bacterium]